MMLNIHDSSTRDDISTHKIKAANNLTLEKFRQLHIDPASLIFKGKDGRTYYIVLKRSADLTAEEFQWCFDLIYRTSHEAYKSSEQGWRPEHKKTEMADPDLRYLLVRRSDTDGAGPGSSKGLVGFCSCMLTTEEDYETVYVYELHVEETARRTGLGRHLMIIAESIGRRAEMEKCMLTVFTCNENGESFYRSMRYTEARDSPRDKVSRSGLVRKPEYYILEKDL